MYKLRKHFWLLFNSLIFHSYATFGQVSNFLKKLLKQNFFAAKYAKSDKKNELKCNATN